MQEVDLPELSAVRQITTRALRSKAMILWKSRYEGRDTGSWNATAHWAAGFIASSHVCKASGQISLDLMVLQNVSTSSCRRSSACRSSKLGNHVCVAAPNS